MASSSELLDKVVDLVNEAKVESQAQKTYLLAQVKEICLNRDPSLLPDVIPMVADFQAEFNASLRKFVATFMREVVRAHPEHVGLVVPVASHLMNDENANVRKTAVLLANTIYRPALERLVSNGSMQSAQQEWSALEKLRQKVLSTITDTSGPGDISMVAVKFASTVVLACVGGRGLGPGSSREDKSVQKDLSPSHPFLLADTLDQAGHALARQMVGWLVTSGVAGGGTVKGGGWGTGFGAQHYTVLINALQSLATNRAALFADIAPAFASALEKVNGSGEASGDKNGGTGKKNAAASEIVPEGLREAASSLRSACLKLLKVAPGPSKAVQRLAAAAALAGPDAEAKAAVEGNSSLRGRIKVPPRPRLPAAVLPVRILAVTPDKRQELADLAASASQGKVPKPPPGYRHKRTKGFPLSDLDTLFGHVLNALGPDIATLKSPATGSSGNAPADSKSLAGKKRARSPSTVIGEEGPSSNGRAPMDVDADDVPNEGIKSEPTDVGDSVDPIAAGLDDAKKAFSRVLAVWEGTATEGKYDLHERVMARLGRILVETEAANPRKGREVKVAASAEVVLFVTEDYRRRYQAALALLMDMYVADITAAGATSKRDGTPGPKRARRRGFDLYDEALLSLLANLATSLEATWRQKLFTQTLLECPRVPPAALDLVCGLCDGASKPCDVQTGLVTLKDLIFSKPSTRNICVPSVLRFTHHENNDVRTKAVRLASNLMWPEKGFQPSVQAFAKQALASIRSPEVKEEKVKENTPAPVEPKVEPRAREEDVVDFEAEDDEEEAQEAAGDFLTPPAQAPVAPLPPGAETVGPWRSPPESEAAARVRLSLYFALCVKSRTMLAGLMDAYVTATPTARAGIMAELSLLARAAARAFGETGVLALMAAAPVGAKALVVHMLDLLVPKDTNKPSPELVAATQRLRRTRLAAERAGAEAVKKEEEAKEGDTSWANSGIEYIVPVLGGLGRAGFSAELPLLLQADDDTIKAAFRRLTQSTKGAMFSPAELVVLLNRFDYTAAGVPVKRLTRALSLCFENKVVYNYPVLREALNVMSQVPSPGASATQLPLLLMRTVMISVTTFPELKNFVATVVLVRLVQQKAWMQPRIWDGFLRCAKMMAKESGATSFIALVQLPEQRLREALAHPVMKGVKDPLRRYAQTLVKVDPGVKAVLGLEIGTRDSSAAK